MRQGEVQIDSRTGLRGDDVGPDQSPVSQSSPNFAVFFIREVRHIFHNDKQCNRMFHQAVLRRCITTFHHPIRILRRHAMSESTQHARISHLESRLPRFLSRILVPLRTAPVSHISAFLILHELTAVLPLVGLTAGFHYFNWLPPYISDLKWFKDGTERFGKYARKKGWVTEEKRSGRWFGRGESGVRIVVELATAYAIVKVLLPLRLVVSVWGTPWFARWTVLPVVGKVKGWFGRGMSGKGAQKVVAASPAAGTGAVGGGVLPKDITTGVK